LRHFLRASFDQHERALGLLEEELTIVRMYLDIEMLRFGSRLKVEQNRPCRNPPHAQPNRPA
jgi:LytS/YehU family sensor histidine kinase